MQKRVVRPWAAAIAVVFILSMLAPAAMADPAAPEFVHGLNITSPTALAPAFLEEEGDQFHLLFDVPITGLQVVEAEVSFFLRASRGLQCTGGEWLEVEPEAIEIDPDEMNSTIHYDVTLTLDDTDDVEDDGWYDIQVELQEDGSEFLWFDCEAMAVLVDGEEPEVDLDKPSDDHWFGIAFVTGNAYMLQGTARDDWGIAPLGFFTVADDGHESVEWQIQYCDEFFGCFWENDWIRIPVSAQVRSDNWTYWATWDSSTVPDTSDEWFALIRMCAWDRSGNTNCEDRSPDRTNAVLRDGQQFQNPWDDTHWVDINNYFDYELQLGWNLISLPLIPYNSAIADVTKHIAGNLGSVWTWTNGVWQSYDPDAAVNSLTTMQDGKGYWVNIETEPEPDFWMRGTYNAVGPIAFPMYPVQGSPAAPGLNLIGYTQFGRPTWMDTDDAEEYLGPNLFPNAQAMIFYNAETGLWDDVELDPAEEDNLELGQGYILYSLANGVITP